MTLPNTPQPPERDDDYSPAAMDHDQADELAVTDPLTGRALPTTPPTEAQALAEQSALDVPVGDTEQRVRAWLAAIIEDQPEGAYLGAYDYEDHQRALEARALLDAAARPAPSLTQALGDPGSYTKRRSRKEADGRYFEPVIDWQERAVRIAMGEQEIDR